MELDLRTEAGFADACKWVREILSVVGDGKAWIIPRTGCIIRVTSHKDKTATLFNAGREPTLPVLMVILGWKITKE